MRSPRNLKSKFLLGVLQVDQGHQCCSKGETLLQGENRSLASIMQEFDVKSIDSSTTAHEGVTVIQVHQYVRITVSVICTHVGAGDALRQGSGFQHIVRVPNS